MERGIIILDFGSQYNQLIGRRVREMGVYSEIIPYYTPLEEIKERNPFGIILSGGPSSVNAEDAHLVSKEIFELGIPVLGICYGMQLTAHLLGGKVAKGVKGEYGKAELEIVKACSLFDGVKERSIAWMSHFDEVETAPQGFDIVAKSGVIAGMANEDKKIFTVQFHPEVSHTEEGSKMLENFVLNICQSERSWKLTNYIERTVAEIKEKVGSQKVILGLSGGVDSSVAAVLIHKAIGDQLTCIFVDTGLLRKDEAKKVMENYGQHFHMNIKLVDAADRFLSKLAGVDDPEQKRKIIGNEFIAVFDEESHKIEGAKFLAQGTIYPDVIESQSVKGPSAVIKSHHNVGGLPEEMEFELLEPLRELFKDEVRKVGEELGIPHHLVYRHPFPGPGLGIRVLGAVDVEKVRILQEADDIFIEELYKNDLYEKVSQAFVVLLPVKSVGVMGDERTYEYTAVVRSANTIDFMTATWSKLPYEFLETVSNRIINEVRGINRVAYDISSKPPATIEWE
ncbi:glutamine-hydrolyzing GMP synthase [Elizabethkingia anophelis]|uniref:GMP synthase [glutamine-hydrolyzing] n=3 Tax=Elizabethkingia anophelis TaxID=1117645 RepID=X5KBD8_9FLAO|nr:MULTISPECIES: glutamine-hydrolyzing GMP synthase [Elizabethkingia]AIL45768.1 GMP synthase [glutamine-hydrolyzing] [Elizabethkingia anophelis NUHP1]AKH94312.1 GMP synthase [Elizabethkingia anophelis FMS-007]AMR40541.1 glutamine-hydrolyzing GMP synthase [Elizabethkingia anophelis]AMX47177.1 glutamine-hydrolyzing GMP synthase [Elizabethkingia anophelis]AMX50637.1 glutamine-hydrolyzing GMP synthase [Elizabethkingia anophelis]